MSHYRPRLVGSVGLSLVSLTCLGRHAQFCAPLLQQNTLSSVRCMAVCFCSCIYLQLDETTQETIILSFCLQAEQSIMYRVTNWLFFMEGFSRLTIPSGSALSLSLCFFQGRHNFCLKVSEYIDDPFLPVEALPGYRRWPLHSLYLLMVGIYVRVTH